ncbi:MAG TPA: DUF5777 family beta-barrel protein [Terriglobales bacterium]|nr:DUF5777 family beta-barrel protein [Terriglobales bacterium]
MRCSKILERLTAGLFVYGLLVANLGFSQTPAASATPADLGVSFVKDSTSQIVVVRDGKKYIVDLVSHEIKEAGAESSSLTANNAPASDAGQPSSPMATANIYRPGDDLVFSVPTGRPLDRHGLYLNFTHRFPYGPAFTGPAEGGTLLGLDNFAIPSFGLRYGITSKLSVMATRSPSVIGRPIEVMAAYNFLDEHNGNPINAALRFSVDGQNDFGKNFAESFELVTSKSLGRRAQIYAVPTLSLHARPLLSENSITDAPPDLPCSEGNVPSADSAIAVRSCANTFSIGLALAVDIRPTVALVAETIPTLMNGDELGIHRPSYGFGIQKKIWRHAFTFGFTNGPTTMVSQRGGTRATFLGDTTADKPGGLFIGFDLTRQIF